MPVGPAAKSLVQVDVPKIPRPRIYSQNPGVVVISGGTVLNPTLPPNPKHTRLRIIVLTLTPKHEC